MWSLEDETGEIRCMLYKPNSENRDKYQEQIIEAGLMPDDVIGVSGNFNQSGEIFVVDDLHFPMKERHQKPHHHLALVSHFYLMYMLVRRLS